MRSCLTCCTSASVILGNGSRAGHSNGGRNGMEHVESRNPWEPPDLCQVGRSSNASSRVGTLKAPTLQGSSKSRPSNAMLQIVTTSTTVKRKHSADTQA